MKILVISGFLGAGKTTFIKTMAENTGREFAILENEYGSAGVDGDRLKSSIPGRQVNIWEMAEGCICCSMKGDFTASVLTIANSVDPEFLVIEPTGVGMLSSIMNSLRQIEYERITLLAPVVIVDGLSFERYSAEYQELCRDQIASASLIVISKMEQASMGEQEALRQKLRRWNPDAQITAEHYSTKDREWWAHLLETGYNGRILESRNQSTEELPDTFSIKDVSLESPEHLILLVNGIVHGEFGEIFRAKGCVRAGDHWFCFDTADSRYMITGAEKGQGEKAVFIGKNIRRQSIRRYFLLSTKTIRKGRDRGYMPMRNRTAIS